jgi:hypothetical protein
VSVNRRFVVGFSAGAGVAVILIFAIARAETRSAERAEQARKNRQTNTAATKASALAPRDPLVDPQAYAIECEEAEFLDRAAIPRTVLAKCSTAHFALAQKCFAERDVGCTRNALDHARTEGGAGDAYQKLAADLERAEMAQVRKRYADALRTRFLDQGLDAKVWVSGPDGEDVTLSCVIFNDVWARRMQQDGLLEEMCTVGYKRVRLTDGYDYGVHWDCKKP